VSPHRSVFRRLAPLLFALGLCGTLFADSEREERAEQEQQEERSEAECVKTPEGGAAAAVGEEFACKENGSGGVDSAAGEAVASADSSSGRLFWLDAPLFADLPIEALYCVAEDEAAEGVALQMQRAVLGSEGVRLWESDAGETDLFAEASSRLQLAQSDTLELRVSTPVSETGSVGVIAASDFTARGARFAPLAAATPSLVNTFDSVERREAGAHVGYLASAFAQTGPVHESAHAVRTWSSPSVFSAGSRPQLLASDRAPLPIEQVKFEKVAQWNWGPTKNVLAIGNYLVTADRQLGALKLDGVGEGWDREGFELGRVVNLEGHTLTLTGAGLLSAGEKRNKIWNGTLATTRDNFEVHVTGGGPGYGGLEISATLVNGPSAATGLVKTGEGELILSNQEANTFKGEVRVERGTLTLRSWAVGGAISSKTIFVGDGSGPAILNLKGGVNNITPEATVTLRGGENGESAVLRFEKTHPNKGVVQTLKKLVIEGSSVIEFIDPFTPDGTGKSPHKNALYIDELDLKGDLTIRGWEEHDTQIFIKRAVQPDAELLSKIHVEGHANLRVSAAGNGFWSLEAAPIPEPATCGAIVAAGACAVAIWRKRKRCRTLPSVGRMSLSRFG